SQMAEACEPKGVSSAGLRRVIRSDQNARNIGQGASNHLLGACSLRREAAGRCVVIAGIKVAVKAHHENAGRKRVEHLPPGFIAESVVAPNYQRAVKNGLR